MTRSQQFHPFFGFEAFLASMHRKERAIAKPLKSAFEMELLISSEIDTDVLGTFSGEIERIGSPKEVVLKKAKLGLQFNGLCRFAIATEGSFGAHPIVPLLPSHHELIVFYDRKAEIAIYEQMIFNRTNFGNITVSSANEESLDHFLTQIRFGSHGVIVKPHKPKFKTGLVMKGINHSLALSSAILKCKEESLDSRVQIETDMRAHYNPTRMIAIRKLTQKLIERLHSLCPKCHYPGWGITQNEKGLPCEDCEFPTNWIKSVIYECQSCNNSEVLPRKDGLTHAPSGQCELCNP